MTNEAAISGLKSHICGHVQPAHMCGGWIDGVLFWLMLLVSVLLIAALVILALFRIRRRYGDSLVTAPTGVLRLCGVTLGVTGILLLWHLYNSIVFALFVLASDSSPESKQSFLLAVFLWPQRFILVVTAQTALWAVLAAVCKRIRNKPK